MPGRRLIEEDSLEATRRALPERVPVMPVRSTVIFPTGATGLQVGFPPNVEVLMLHPDRNLVVALVHTEEEEMPVDPASLEKVGVVARVLNRLNLPGGTIQATIQGLIRVHLENVRLEDGHYTAYPRLVEETPVEDEEAAQCVERILTTLGGIGAQVERLADVPRILRKNIGDPGRFADLVATLAHFPVADKDEVLQRLDVGERLRFVLQRLDGEWERVRGLASQAEAPASASARSGNRPLEIRKQIKALQAELGELDPGEKETVELLRHIDHAQLPSRVASLGRQEAERLRAISPTSAEATEIRTYIDTIIALPWERSSESGPIDLETVRAALDEKHVGLEDVKRRILEFLSVATLRGNVRGLVPCIVGPPGVGKRSLVAAVARGLGRPLARVELGGRGETQLVGARRTRPARSRASWWTPSATPACATRSIVLEEIDEIGLGNVEGDPVEALEEFLDPDHRDAFVDRYLDGALRPLGGDPHRDRERLLPASRAGLRDYLIEIRIAGYTPEEKVEIARKQAASAAHRGARPRPEEIEVRRTPGLPDPRLRARRRGRQPAPLALGDPALRRAREGDRRGGPLGADRDMVEEVLGIPRYPDHRGRERAGGRGGDGARVDGVRRRADVHRGAEDARHRPAHHHRACSAR
jgi:ATP-dependent Lon protease